MKKKENEFYKDFSFGDFFKEVFDELYGDSDIDYKRGYEDYLDELREYLNGGSCKCGDECCDKKNDKGNYNETKMMFASLPNNAKITFDGTTLSFDGGSTCARISYDGNWNDVVKVIIAETTKSNSKKKKEDEIKEAARAEAKKMIEEIKNVCATRKIELIILGKKQYEWIKTFNDGKDIKDILGYPIYKSSTEDYFKIV